MAQLTRFYYVKTLEHSDNLTLYNGQWNSWQSYVPFTMVSEHPDNLIYLLQWSVNRSVNILTILHTLYNGQWTSQWTNQWTFWQSYIPCTMVMNKSENILTILHTLYNDQWKVSEHLEILPCTMVIEHSEIFIPCTIVSEQPCNPKSIILCALSASLHRM